jgi:ribosomal protein S18 acetylase RimI-like enzyme
MNSQRETNLEDAVTLRLCTHNDSDFYYNVKKTTLKLYVEQTYGEWKEDFQRDRHIQNFKPETTQIIQFHLTDIGILAIEEDSDTVMVHNIEILPEYQNKGIGSHLMDEVIQNAKEKGNNISLQVLKTNPRARKFYERLGFKVETETETHFLMKLHLSKKSLIFIIPL